MDRFGVGVAVDKELTVAATGCVDPSDVGTRAAADGTAPGIHSIPALTNATMATA
jgi:hypothetical protein